jgi:hypothetical protein
MAPPVVADHRNDRDSGSTTASKAVWSVQPPCTMTSGSPSPVGCSTCSWTPPMRILSGVVVVVICGRASRAPPTATLPRCYGAACVGATAASAAATTAGARHARAYLTARARSLQRFGFVLQPPREATANNTAPWLLLSMRRDTPVAAPWPHHRAAAFVAGTSASSAEDSATAVDDDQAATVAPRSLSQLAQSDTREPTAGQSYMQWRSAVPARVSVVTRLVVGTSAQLTDHFGNLLGRVPAARGPIVM